MGKEREDGAGSPRRRARRRPQRGAALRRRGRRERGRGEASAVDRRGEAAMGENCAGDRGCSWRENWATGGRNRAQLAKKTARGRFLLWKFAQAFRFGRSTARKLLTRGPGWSGGGAGRSTRASAAGRAAERAAWAAAWARRWLLGGLLCARAGGSWGWAAAELGCTRARAG